MTVGTGARLFLIMAFGYLMSYGLRAVNATIAPELVAEIGLDNAQLGGLTSAYFLTFALMQLPLGIGLDRYGPRRVNAALMMVAALGCIVFAGAGTFAGLWVGRALIGLGFAAALMAPYAMYRVWFSPEHQTRMAAWTLMFGVAGVVLATLPVRAALRYLDWRELFWICAVLLLVIAVTMWFGLPKRREPTSAQPQPLSESLLGYAEILRSRFFRRMVMMSAAMQGSFIALQTLWLGPWFTRVLQMTPEQSAGALFGFNATLLVSYLASGYLAPRLGSKLNSVVRLAAITVAVTTALLALIAAAPAFAGIWAWVVIAAFNAVYTPIQARVGLSFPARLSGRALTGFNLIVFVCAFVIQAGLGVLVDGLVRAGLTETDAFRAGLGAIAGLLALVWIRFVSWRTATGP